MRTYLSARFFGFLAVLQLLAIATISFSNLWIAVVLLFTALTVFVINEWKRLPRSEDFFLEVQGDSTACLDEKFSIRLKIAGLRGIRLSSVKVLVPESDFVHFAPPVVNANWVMDGGVRKLAASLDGHCLRLGYFRIDKISLLIFSPLGLCVRVLECSFDPLTRRIVPKSFFLSERHFHELISRDRLLHLGSRQKMRARVRDQLHSIRRYQYPDSFADIDQKKSAKYGVLMTREYDTLIQQRLVLCFDLGRTMAGNVRNSQKVDYYLSTGLALARHALKLGDQLGICSFSSRILSLIPSIRSQAELVPIFSGESRFQVREEESNYELLVEALSKIATQRSVVMILSDLSKPSIQEEVYTTFRALAKRHLVVAIGLIPDELEIGNQLQDYLNNSTDEFSTAKLIYSYWIDDRFSKFRELAARSGGSALLLPERYWMSAVPRVYSTLRQSLAA